MRNFKPAFARAALPAAILFAPAAALANADFNSCAGDSGDAQLRACTAFLARGRSATARDRAIENTAAAQTRLLILCRRAESGRHQSLRSEVPCAASS